MGLVITPTTLSEVNAFIAAHHRHLKPARGCIFCAAVSLDGVVVGVVSVGRPTSRMLQDGYTCEINRCATDGTKNACSKLYGLARRVARGLGYRRLITYTLPEEGGASLRAAGYLCEGLAGGGGWSRSDRPRVDTHPTQKKIRWTAWEAEAIEATPA